MLNYKITTKTAAGIYKYFAQRVQLFVLYVDVIEHKPKITETETALDIIYSNTFMYTDLCMCIQRKIVRQ